MADLTIMRPKRRQDHAVPPASAGPVDNPLIELELARKNPQPAGGKPARPTAIAERRVGRGRQLDTVPRSEPLRAGASATSGVHGNGARVEQDLLSTEEAGRLLQTVLLQRGVVAAAAHDMQTPLATLKLSLSLLERRIGGLSPEATELLSPELRLAQRAVGQITRQVRELRDITLLEMGAPISLELERFGLAELVTEAVASHQQATNRQIRLTVVGSDPHGWWDRTRLMRVVENLLSNAIKYSPAKSLIFVRVSSEMHGGRPWAVLTVEDQGIGIAEQDLPHIFDGLYRGANVAAETRGSGIGLLSVRLIVEAHGGQISVESRVRVGTCFTARLPLDPDGPEPGSLDPKASREVCAQRSA